MRRKVKLYMFFDDKWQKKKKMENMLHCNGIDCFIMFMGNFNCGPISYNDIVSSMKPRVLLRTEKDFCHRKELSGTEKDLDIACYAIKTCVK